MIEFPPPPPLPAVRSRRNRITAVVAAVVALVVVVAIAALVNHHRTRTAETPARTPTSAPAPAPTTSGGGSGGSGGTPVPTVSCPLITDEQSHLQYRCIDDYLVQDETDTGLGLRIALNHEVEPGWVITEGSGNPLSQTPDSTVISYRAAAGPTAADVRTVVTDRIAQALVGGYGDNPTSKTLSRRTRSFGGVEGYEAVTEITVNPSFRQANALKVKTERLWVVGVPTAAGVSVFMMSIPDERSDLWPKAETTVGTLHVI